MPEIAPNRMFAEDVNMVNIISQFAIIIQIGTSMMPKISHILIRIEDKDKDKKINQDFVGHAGCNKHEVLLQTPRANVFSIDESAEVNSRLLFDSGSQRTYI